MRDKLTEVERVEVGNRVRQFAAEPPPDIEIPDTPLNRIDSMNARIRAAYPGKEFEISAVLLRDGTYRVQVDGRDVSPRGPE